MNEKEIIAEFKSQFGNDVLDITPFPKPYFKNISDVKAIYLGCDPSNKHNTSLQYAFAINNNLPIFNNFHKTHLSNLNEINLGWENVYVQNLCQNHFQKETSQNLKLCEKVAQWWIPYLKKELEKLGRNIPVLLTSSYLYKVLLLVDWRKYKPIDFYRSKVEISVPAEFILLQRPLIPLYRNRRKVDYHLSNPEWERY